MGLSNAERQRRWRAKREALVRGSAEAIDRVLLRDAERCERGEMSEQERIALADRLADAAMGHLRRSQEFARLARRVRAGEG